MSAEIDTHGLVCEFGKRHRGKPWTRVPADFLLWMVNTGAGPVEIAHAELKRRGTVVPEMDISGHAIDRASQQLIGKWMAMRKPNEGIYSWLLRVATDARKNSRIKGDKYLYSGMKFVFHEGIDWPVLKTVMPEGGRE